MTANADIPDPVGESRQRYELGNNSSHKGTIVPTFTLDEYEDVKRRAFIAGLRAAREAAAGMYLVEPDPAWDTPVSACVDAIDALRDTPTRINMEDPL